MRSKEETAKGFWKRLDEVKGNTSIADICRELGLNYQTIKENRSDLRLPSLDVMIGMAEIVGADPAYLLTGTVSGAISPEMAHVRDNNEARAVVKVLIEKPGIVSHLLALLQGLA